MKYVLYAGAFSMLFATNSFADGLEIIEAPRYGSDSGYYVAGKLSIGAFGDTTFGLTAPTGGAGTFTDIDNDYDTPAFGGSVSIGKVFDFDKYQMRTEVELGYSEADVESHTLVALGATFDGDNAFGKTSMFYGMVNAAVDIPTSTSLTPYLLAGIGAARLDYDNHGITLATATVGLGPGDVTAMENADIGFAWQIGTGVSYDINEALTLDVGYRYFNVEGVSLTGTLGDETSVDLSQHKAEFGLRYNF